MSKSADADIKRKEKGEPKAPEPCDHICTSNCRREGCNCECGEWHRRELEEMYDQ